MNLNAGGLRHTFTPEAPMVMAMSLNELCQYPESVRAIHTFKKGYEKSFQWLQKNITGNLYPDAVQYVRRAQGATVPDRVASEWVRSPLFISSQDELNLLFDESESTAMLGRTGAREHHEWHDERYCRCNHEWHRFCDNGRHNGQHRRRNHEGDDGRHHERHRVQLTFAAL